MLKVKAIAQEIVSDNGPPFTSFEFEQFSKQFNIILTKSPAHSGSE